MKVQLSSGQVTQVPLNQIARVGYRKRSGDVDEWEYTTPMVLMRSGDRVSVQLPAEPIEVVTYWRKRAANASAPTGVTSIADDARVAVGWNLVPGATGYNLKRATNSGGSYTVIAANIATPDFEDVAVNNFTTYYYVVSALNGAGESGNSSEVSATPSLIVSGLTAVVTNSQVLLQWNATGGTNYTVKRSTVTGGTYTIVAGGIMTTNFVDPYVFPCETYFYVVTMSVNGTESLNSTEAFGLVQIEAMMNNVPCVASALPGVRRPVQMTGMGKVTPIGDAQALAEAILEILADPQKYRRDPAEILSKARLSQGVDRLGLDGVVCTGSHRRVSR